ncbi:MAG TPA: outer-membrane lipoprotein carrier protein LolA [Caulobacteraceae bacterium]|nr:outer-membrane lipoprotein carrier protein LolA [Caulobacteraceae bacterium]
MPWKSAACALALAVVLVGNTAAAAPLAPDDQAAVDQASAYLDGFGEMKGHFTQTDSRGAVSEGTFYLKRPGLARFAYDPPSNLLVVSDGHSVVRIDPRLRTRDRYPLGATPLALFLAKHVRLDKGVEVTRVVRTEEGFSLTARDAHHPRAGEITLTFGAHPLKLEDWSMVDAGGQQTHVRLDSIAPTSGLDPSLFVLPDAGAERAVPLPPN